MEKEPPETVAPKRSLSVTPGSFSPDEVEGLPSSRRKQPTESPAPQLWMPARKNFSPAAHMPCKKGELSMHSRCSGRFIA